MKRKPLLNPSLWPGVHCSSCFGCVVLISQPSRPLWMKQSCTLTRSGLGIVSSHLKCCFQVAAALQTTCCKAEPFWLCSGQTFAFSLSIEYQWEFFVPRDLFKLCVIKIIILKITFMNLRNKVSKWELNSSYRAL